jgi:hypothetical protein
MTNPFDLTTYSAPPRNARAQGALTSGRHFFTNPGPEEKGRFFMHFVNSRPDVIRSDGRIVHFERLLLPFSRGGVAVDRILASLETVSPEGAFDNRDILKSSPKPPAFALCATIQH